MANRAIVVSWGASVAGREEMGLGVFMGAIQYYGERKHRGDIEDFKIYISNQGNLGGTSGHLIVEGSADQIAALTAREDYLKILLKANHVVHNLNVIDSSTGDEVMRRIELLQMARKELGV